MKQNPKVPRPLSGHLDSLRHHGVEVTLRRLTTGPLAYRGR